MARGTPLETEMPIILDALKGENLIARGNAPGDEDPHISKP
jgi:hypothetical protein